MLRKWMTVWMCMFGVAVLAAVGAAAYAEEAATKPAKAPAPGAAKVQLAPGDAVAAPAGAVPGGMPGQAPDRPGRGMMPPMMPMPDPGAPGRTERLRHDDRMNVIDSAYYSIAEIRLEQKQVADAVATLQQLLVNSPDPLARALTCLNLAEIYRTQLNNPAKAVEQYKKVTGIYAAEALERLAQMYEELDQIDEATTQLQGLAETSRDDTQKVLALKALAELLVRTNRGEQAVEVLGRLTKVISYEKAAVVSKALQAEETRKTEQMTRGMERTWGRAVQAWQQRLQGGRGRAGAAAELRPNRVRPAAPDAAPAKKKEARAEERPIQPPPAGPDMPNPQD